MERLTDRQFSETTGVEDWRVLAWGASAYFPTGSFAVGAQLVEAVARVSAGLDHHPDVDLRADGVTLRVWTRERLALTTQDVALARAVSAAARDLGLTADSSGLRDVDLALDVMVRADVLPFWRVVLGYEPVSDTDIADPQWRHPGLFLQQMDAPRTQRNRFHVDVRVPHDRARALVDAAVAAGGRITYDAEAPAWWTLQDAEGNEVDIATWEGRPWEE